MKKKHQAIWKVLTIVLTVLVIAGGMYFYSTPIYEVSIDKIDPNSPAFLALYGEEATRLVRLSDNREDRIDPDWQVSIGKDHAYAYKGRTVVVFGKSGDPVSTEMINLKDGILKIVESPDGNYVSIAAPSPDAQYFCIINIAGLSKNIQQNCEHLSIPTKDPVYAVWDPTLEHSFVTKETSGTIGTVDAQKQKVLTITDKKELPRYLALFDKTSASTYVSLPYYMYMSNAVTGNYLFRSHLWFDARPIENSQYALLHSDSTLYLFNPETQRYAKLFSGPGLEDARVLLAR